jgi:hypothetical protein
VIPSATARRSRTTDWIVAIACVVAVVEIGRVGILFRYRTDEYTYAHAAWAIAHGQEPYRDYFLHHFPLSMQLGSLVFRLSDDPGSIQWLRWMMAPVWGLTLACATWINRRHGTGAALATVPILATLRTWVDFGTEFRPDTLAWALFLFAFAVSTHRGRTRSVAIAFVGGLAWTAAVWASQKVLIYGSFLWLAALLDLRRRRFFLEPSAFIVGTLVAAVPVALYLTATANWVPWIQWCYRWGLVHERFDGRRALWMSVEETFTYSWPVLVFGVIAVAVALRRIREASPADVLLLVGLGTTTLSFVLQKAPYGYSLLPCVTFVAMFAARAVAGIADRLGSTPRAAWLTVFAGTTIAAATWPERALQNPDKSNAGQRAMLERIASLTSPNDPIYDNVGTYVARPHVHFFFFTDETLRKLMPDVLEREIPEAIETRQAVVAVHDSRWRGLPRGLRTYLESHFVDVGDDLMLWGKVFSGDGTFTANRDARYYVTPSEAAANIEIDGAPAGSDVFELSRGEHTVRSSAQGFAILWLPRDGSRPEPTRPGESLGE